MSLKCGIVGLPNVGKSTLFNALTCSMQAAAENYPFCTVEPNIGVAPLPDARLDELAAVAGAARTVYAAVEFADIAGLVKGASQGAGLGNRFLAHIRETDGVVHVARCFDGGDIAHVDGRVDPAADAEIVNLELILADLASVEKSRDKWDRIARVGDKQARARLAVADKIKETLDQGKPARAAALNEAESAVAKEFFLLTMKPVLYVANVGEDGFADNPLADALEQFAAAEGARTIRICAQLEAEIATMAAAERADFLRDLGLAESGLARLAKAAFALLGLQTFFTAGEKEARAWTIPRGATARDAAGVIHDDFARGFIRAEVISCGDFINCGGEAQARAAGKMKSEGKEYIVQDGDVIHFRFNV